MSRSVGVTMTIGRLGKAFRWLASTRVRLAGEAVFLCTGEEDKQIVISVAQHLPIQGGSSVAIAREFMIAPTAMESMAKLTKQPHAFPR